MVLICIYFGNAFGQPKNGMEHYHVIGKDKIYNWISVLHRLTRHGLYGELRYNYEDLNTFSLYAGKKISGEKKMSYSITPMIGLLVGQYKGISLATNVDLKYENVSMSAQLQYTRNNQQQSADFFYNWSELTWQPVKWLYGGVSVQQTKIYHCIIKNEAGMLLGFEINKIVIPVYLFSPFSNDRNLLIGINMDW